MFSRNKQKNRERIASDEKGGGKELGGEIIIKIYYVYVHIYNNRRRKKKKQLPRLQSYGLNLKIFHV